MTRTLLIAGADVPRIGLGTNRLHDTAEHAAFVRDAITAGIRHIDTARLYTGGSSETAIGAALASGRPDGLVVATKGGYGDGHPETIAREIEESLRQLRVDRIDLYYLHRVDAGVPIEDSLAAIVRERDRGRIAHIGVSNVSLEQLARARAVTEIAAVQNHYNLAHRDDEDVLDHCATEGIPFVPFFPLRDEPAVLREIATGHGVTSAQVVLAWLLTRSPTTLPIPGTLSVDHVRENLAALELQLSDDDIAALDAAVLTLSTRRVIDGGTTESRELYGRIQRAVGLTERLNRIPYSDREAIREAWVELTGTAVDDTFHLIPPLYSDYGLNIRVGANVFINQACMLNDIGGIEIGDDVMIGPRVSLLTAGHPLDPGRRRRQIVAAPIVIERNVWLGAGATVLQGVTVGVDAVVAAGAVVTRDVPSRTLVAGVPARVLREIGADDDPARSTD